MKAGHQLATLAVIASLALASPASAEVPQTMTVQGVLRDQVGVPITGSTSFEFSLLEGTLVVWRESTTIWLEAGLFTVTLGATTPIPMALFVNRQLAFGVTIGDESMTPIPLASVPYAFRAESAASADAYFNDVSWGQLIDLPPGFAAGTDDGNVYAPGAGLRLVGNTFSVSPTTVQSRVSSACPAGQAISAINEDGTVTCQNVMQATGMTGTFPLGIPPGCGGGPFLTELIIANGIITSASTGYQGSCASD